MMFHQLPFLMSSFFVACYLFLFAVVVAGTYLIAAGVGIPIAGAFIFGVRLFTGAMIFVRRIFKF
ncbi:MAG: hypothetical protein UX94_C0009G0004 [Parcubacteria group bacterium GW2011_GWA2_47_21]|nr:MAG: hypothetical protein UX94_C0009G0004 [Parcubacteria group bacterium GW2011_GWA2_47_21]